MGGERGVTVGGLGVRWLWPVPYLFEARELLEEHRDHHLVDLRRQIL